LFLMAFHQFHEYSTVSDWTPLAGVINKTTESNNHQFWILL
jgi:hypothetical protein